MKNVSREQGFTLLEILLVVAAIAILAGIVILAINPGKQLADTRNAQRDSDVTTISNAIYQYSIDNDGDIPSGITTTVTEICDTGSADCTGLVDLSVLTNAGEYIVDMPEDPNGTCAAEGVCYEVSQDVNGRITVSAPDAEEGETVTVTR